MSAVLPSRRTVTVASVSASAARHRMGAAGRLGVLMAGALLAAGAAAAAQSPPIAAVKAAFLLNFVNFATWPSESLPPGQPLSLCIVGDDAVADALTHSVQGRTINGHALHVAAARVGATLRGCHLVYASDLDDKGTAALMEALKGAPVFTVSDKDRFAESGGIAQLFIEHERMRFAINMTAADRGPIRLSSKLLSLAKVIKE
jgi:hypothetical protein